MVLKAPGECALLMIKISQNLINQMIDYFVSTLPQEACGIFIGERELSSNDYLIDEFTPMTNAAYDPDRTFRMEPAEWVPMVYKYAGNKKRQMVGIVHSHPKTAAVPSNADQLTQWKSLPSYWIVSLSPENPVDIKAYRFTENSYHEVSIEINN
jgi:proteasome lid subunit RPN8/RPN11